MVKYEPAKLEAKWQEKWEKSGIYSPDLDRAQKPFYNLMMFPYPSAEGLHVGNMYAFSGSDIYGRFARMQGFDVFEPIGLDGFGIHSENYALKVGRHPKEQAKISEKNFYRQLRATGNAYDWTRKLETYDAGYYKWTQWIFIQLFKKGLAYRAKAPVNFCPVDKTVLADEQVVNGRCERCGTLVEKRDLEQWFFKITDYADRLLENLEKLDWSERVKIAQRQWIGRSEGVRIEFKVKNSNLKVAIFTTRPDTLFGATFMVMSPDSDLIEQLTTAENNQKVSEYIKIWQLLQPDAKLEEREKSGIFTGSYAINPATKEEIPIWVANYVVSGYGADGVMGVPGHDQRDFEFAKKYNLPIKQVILRLLEKVNSRVRSSHNLEEAYEGAGMIVDSGEWNGWRMPEQIGKVVDWLEKRGIGKTEVSYHLRDWLISRQRYWGPPIPIIYCRNCARGPVTGSSHPTSSATTDDKVIPNPNGGLRALDGTPSARATPRTTVIGGEHYAIIPVPDDQLPVLLPGVADWKPKGTGQSPLATVASFVKTKCPNCRGPAVRETDVSDTFLDSAWYFLRYLATDISNKAWVRQRSDKWLPVDMYIGGAEHSVLHLLYTRFLAMVFYDLGLVHFEEPFAKFRAHGLLISGGAKMSKSRGNVVVPDAYIDKYGADTLRCYLMFCGRFTQGGDFRDTGIEGMHKFLKRVWNLVVNAGPVAGSSHPTSSTNSSSNVDGNSLVGLRALDGTPSARATRITDDAMHIMHKTTQKVTEDIEDLSYNTAISALMIWLTALEERTIDNKQLTTDKSKVKGQVSIVELEIFLKLLAPFAPHMCEELWQVLRSQKSKLKSQKFESIHSQPWPKYDPKLAAAKKVTLVVQVNGKLRDKLLVEAGISQKEAEKLALTSAKVQKFLGNARPRKVIFVPDRLINLVI